MIAAFRIFLLLHLALVTGYLFFAGVRRGLERYRLATHHQRLRLGQMAFLAALIIPIAAFFIPERPLPHLERTLRAPFSEFAGKLRQPPQQAARPALMTAPSPAFVPIFDWRFVLKSLLIAVFIGATLWRMAWLGRERLRLRGLLRSAVSFRKLGRLHVAFSDAIEIPFAARAGRTAWVVLPNSIAERWSDLRIALKHELQHHRQGDSTWSIAFEVVGAFFILNPALSAWRRALAEQQEFSCDEALLGRRRVPAQDYGSCLYRVAEAALGARATPAGTAGMAHLTGNPEKNQSMLRRRIEMFMDSKPNRRSRAVTWLGTGLALSTFTVAMAAKVATGDADETIRSGVAQTDPEIQKIVDKAVKSAVDRHHAQAAYAVVSDPSTGRVLAVSNVDRRRNNSGTQWSLALRIEPASAFKTLIAAAALDAGITRLDEKHDCENGKYVYGGKTYQDWKPFDKLTTIETVSQSSNICGLKIAQKLGGEKILEALERYGFGSEGTASDFPGARPGRLPRPSEMPSADFLTTLGTGYQGVSVTPLEMIGAYSAIANGGYLLKPQEASAPMHSRQVIRRAFSADTAAKVRQILIHAIDHGTGLNAKSPSYRFAGKTATAYHPDFYGHPTLGGTANVSGFIGLAPAESARLVIYIAVFEPKPEVHGSTQAAPLFREIAENVLRHWKFEADPS